MINIPFLKLRKNQKLLLNHFTSKEGLSPAIIVLCEKKFIFCPLENFAVGLLKKTKNKSEREFLKELINYCRDVFDVEWGFLQSK